MGIHGIRNETGCSRSRPRRSNGWRAVGRPSRSPCSRPGVVCTSQRFAVAWCDGPHALNGSDGHSWDPERNGLFPFSPAALERLASRWPPVALAMFTPRRRLHVAALRGCLVRWAPCAEWIRWAFMGSGTKRAVPVLARDARTVCEPLAARRARHAHAQASFARRSASRFGSPFRPSRPSRPRNAPPSEASDHRVTWPASETPAIGRRQPTHDASVMLHCDARRGCSASRLPGAMGPMR